MYAAANLNLIKETFHEGTYYKRVSFATINQFGRYSNYTFYNASNMFVKLLEFYL
jgi:hypothetical protein